MAPIPRISISVIFSLTGTLLLMWVASRFPGMDIPPQYWVFGGICPVVISLPVSIILVRQSERLKRLHVELAEAYRVLKDVAETDHLTEVLNRATFLKRAESVWSRAPGWILLLDVDHFKAVNDRHGHDVGDRALQCVGAILRKAVRGTDFVGRLGGEEFAIYLDGADRHMAVSIAERVRAAVAGTVVAHSRGSPVVVTVSIGLACVNPAETISECLHLADLAMYRAKDSGRNQISLAA